ISHFSLLVRRPPVFSLFPYTTLFRSLFPLRDGFRLLAFLQEVAAQIEPSIGVIGLQIHDPPEKLSGVRRRVLYDPQQEERIHIVWGETDCLAKFFPGGLLLAHRIEDASFVIAR